MKRPTILLIDHLAEGHHAAFMKLFTKYLVKCGYFVVVAFRESKLTWLHQELATEGVKESDYTVIAIDLSRKKISGFGIFNDAVSVFSLWRGTRKIARAAEKQIGRKLDKVFFAWMDDYLANHLPYQLIDLIFPYTWSGLFFHPWYLYGRSVNGNVSLSSIDNIFRAKGCTSVAVHDEFITDKLFQRIQKPVIVFPEMADRTPASVDFPLPKRIKEAAAGRLVIGLIGLEPRKGTYLLTQVVRKADASKYFFVFCGAINLDLYPEHERDDLKTFFESSSSNVLYYPQRLNEGADVNSVIQALDVIFLVYREFKSSSNFCTKAALFRKPVLATKNYWIGNVTRKYNMGEVVSENNPDEVINALDTLQRSMQVGFDFTAYAKYLELHREEKLEEVFKLVFP